jgi:uncharacterized protein DUF222/HNH endonuclease
MRAFLRVLGSLDAEDVTDPERIDLIRALEELKSAAAAAQARVTVAFDASQRRAQRDAGVPERRIGAGVAAQVALARRESPHRGARHLGLAHALVDELPQTMMALAAGETSEWRATLVARETACLSRDDRRAVDADLAARRGGIGSLGDAELVAEARRLGYRLDPHAVTDRAARAHADRRVTLRPAPDTMAALSALLPAVQGVAVYAALTRQADMLRAQGDGRGRGQIMADTLVERVTGQSRADAVPVEVSVVMPHDALLTDHSEPAVLEGYGPLPAAFARAWLRDLPADAEAWVRRLYEHPVTGRLVTMDSRRRRFGGRHRALLVHRDQRCRTPWCGAPIRHLDHVQPHTSGGGTSTGNAQGLCEACNQVKEAAGWRARGTPSGRVETTTPTGHTYRSHPPPHPRARPSPSRAEIVFARDVVLIA